MADYWIKLYHEIINDKKMVRLSDHQYRRVIELFLLAGKNGQDGCLPCVTDMAFDLRIPDEEMLNDLNDIASTGIIYLEDNNWFVTKFQERQRRATSAERMQRSRERKRTEEFSNESETVIDCIDVTLSNQNVTENKNKNIDIELESDIEEGDLIKSAPIRKLTKRQQFISQFVDTAGVPFSRNEQLEELDHLAATWGHDKILEVARWRAEKPVLNMGQFVASIKTAIPKWNVETKRNGNAESIARLDKIIADEEAKIAIS